VGAEERLRHLIEQLPDGIAIVNAEGEFRFVNRAAAGLFGRTCEALVGHPFGHPLEDEREGLAELDIVRPDGGCLVAELRVVTIEWEGEPATLLSLRDVTDRRQALERAQALEREQGARAEAEAAVRRAHFLSDVSRTLSSALDLETGVPQLATQLVPTLADWCVIDVVTRPGQLECLGTAHRDGAKHEALDALCQRYPTTLSTPSPALMVLRSGEPMRVSDPSDLPSLTQDAEHLAHIERLGTSALLVLPLVARGESIGALTLGRAFAPYSDDDLALAIEVADRAALGISNVQLYQDAQQASRAKSDFLAVMSHELRTPLNAVTGYADLLELEVSGALNAKQREQIRRIKSGARHLQEIVEDILTFSRMEAGREEVHHERFDLREVVSEVAALLEPLAEQKGLEFRVRVPEVAAPIETEPGKVRQILVNLVSNAIKFTTAGSVEVELTPLDSSYCLTVRDTGIGIDAAYLQRIFEPFWQVRQHIRRTVGGTGLGLSVARRLAELLGGALTVSSRVGEGSAFDVTLPRNPA
jgi:PAS domain S-box-containing protein